MTEGSSVVELVVGVLIAKQGEGSGERDEAFIFCCV